MQQTKQATPQNLIGANRSKAGNSSRKPKAAAPKRDKVSNGILKADTHGQVFTPDILVTKMLALRKRAGQVLEPSCGSGAFAKPLHEAGAELVALELDAEHAPAYATVQDFFDYPVTEQFDTVIGNPPYVRYQDIPASTKQKLDMAGFDGRTNLFYFFIKKCVQHLKPGGELIFVVPREFPKATAARHLNRWLFEQGTITDFYETGDEALFIGATPPCCVFRFEKGLMDRTMTDGRVFAEHNGQLFFLPAGSFGVPLSEFFTVAVGGISGADRLYKHAKGNVEVVCSSTRKNGETRKLLHGTHARLMLGKHKEKLLNRGVRRFTETNWWEWGREWKQSPAPRVYVNAKTRQASPFFTHDATAYDGSIFALFPKLPDMDINQAVAILNAVDWNALGFMAGKRFLFAQRALEQTLIPDTVAAQLRAAIAQPVFQLAA
jgi:adenine-specific DNA-methyltransferase